MICDLPNKLLASMFFNLFLYFMTNLRQTPGAFFTFYLFSFACLSLCPYSFTWLAYHRELMHRPWLLCCMNVESIISTGFVLQTGDMKPWVQWIGLINPMAYTLESLMINEVCTVGPLYQ